MITENRQKMFNTVLNCKYCTLIFFSLHIVEIYEWFSYIARCGFEIQPSVSSPCHGGRGRAGGDWCNMAPGGNTVTAPKSG